MITISIVEDNQQFRRGLETILNAHPDFSIISSFENAEKALPALKKNQPDIVICDISLPGMSGTELVQKLKGELRQTQFMMCSIHDENEAVFEALKYGANGYLLKESLSAEDIIRAIHDLYNGGSPMSPYIARKVISSFQKPTVQDEHALLSLREKEVLELVAKGFLYKEIADQLGVTYETVKKHLKNIYQKLQVQNKIEAINKYKFLD